MTIKTCTCNQCRARKALTRGNSKKIIKRLINKKRRKGKEGEVFNFYYA